MFNKIWLIGAVVAMGMLGGCQSMKLAEVNSTKYAHQLNKDNSGIVYGQLITVPDANIKQACDSINNKDERCQHQDNYIVGNVTPEVGIVAGGLNVIALLPKDIKITTCYNNGDDCTFVKVKAEEGIFATLIKIVSNPGEGKCKWVGFPHAGGTVCPDENWDYRKNLRDFSANLGVLTGVSK